MSNLLLFSRTFPELSTVFSDLSTVFPTRWLISSAASVVLLVNCPAASVSFCAIPPAVLLTEFSVPPNGPSDVRLSGFAVSPMMSLASFGMSAVYFATSPAVCFLVAPSAVDFTCPSKPLGCLLTVPVMPPNSPPAFSFAPPRAPFAIWEALSVALLADPVGL